MISGLAPEIQIEVDPTGVGQFLNATAKTPAVWHEFRLGTIDGLVRFTACYRYDPFWMRPVAGTTHAAVPAETQYLLAECADGRCVLIVPLFGEQLRFALAGDATGLLLVGETGDPFAPASGGLAAFVAEGDDPFALMEAAARAVVQRLGTGRRRVDKPLPAFVDDFGWCTWDAFYGEVSPEKVRSGLESFRAGGVEPRLLILDDGWLSVSAENRLQSLAPNAKFAGTLAPTVAMAKQEFGLRTVLAWHAALGHWGGFDVEHLTGFGARNLPRWHGPGMLKQLPIANVFFGPTAGMLPADQFARFYDDLHRQLAAWGVDGVKVDGQAMLEGLSTGSGGRVPVYRAFREALEASVQQYFGGRLINCMSNGNETH
ncbi:MAG: Sip1-related alpha-galactosidase, partial [Verrucomicrobiota bacterium]